MLPPTLTQILRDAVMDALFIAGLGLVVFGISQIYVPAAYIFGGAVLSALVFKAGKR